MRLIACVSLTKYALDETLQPRIVISENISVTREDGEAIQMLVTLSAVAE